MSESSRPLLPRPMTVPSATRARRLPNRSFVYALRGITHLVAHRTLHPSLYSRVGPLALLSLVTVVGMFVLLWLPHVVVLGLVGEPFPRSAAATMILSESAALVGLVAEALLTEKQMVDVFDLVLLSRTKRLGGLGRRAEAMVRAARILDVDDESGERRLGRHIVDPYVKFREGLKLGVYFVLELPLCLVPVVGTALFICLQGRAPPRRPAPLFLCPPERCEGPTEAEARRTGYHIGPLCHYRYFQLAGWTGETKRAFIRRNRFRYFLFGLVHVMLQLIPVASIFFLFSSATGAALWAVDFEKRLWDEQGGDENAEHWAGGCHDCEDGGQLEEEAVGQGQGQGQGQAGRGHAGQGQARRAGQRQAGQGQAGPGQAGQETLSPPPKFLVEAVGGGQKSWLAFWRK